MPAMPALWGGALMLLFASLAIERERVDEWLLGGLERLSSLRRTGDGRRPRSWAQSRG